MPFHGEDDLYVRATLVLDISGNCTCISGVKGTTCVCRAQRRIILRLKALMCVAALQDRQ